MSSTSSSSQNVKISSALLVSAPASPTVSPTASPTASPTVSIVDIPLDTIQHYILPNLELKDTIHLLLSSKYLYHIFTCTSTYTSTTGDDVLTDINIDIDSTDIRTSNSTCASMVTCTLPSSSPSSSISFADRYWKEHCLKRWKSVVFHSTTHTSIAKLHNHTNTPTNSRTHTCTHSSWYQEYKRRHINDSNTKQTIQTIHQLENEIQMMKDMKTTKNTNDNDNANNNNTNTGTKNHASNLPYVNSELKIRRIRKEQLVPLWSNIVQNKSNNIHNHNNTIDAWDCLIELAQQCNYHQTNTTDQTTYENANVNVNGRNNDESFNRRRKRILHDLILGMHRFKICREFQQLSTMESDMEFDQELHATATSATSSNSNTTSSCSTATTTTTTTTTSCTVNNDKDGTKDQHHQTAMNMDMNMDMDMNAKQDHNNISSLEYIHGAILISKFYQNTNDIISDYGIRYNNNNNNNDNHNNDPNLVSEAVVGEPLEESIYHEIDELANYIRQRLIIRWKKNNNNHINEHGGRHWPTRWILEEMKTLFHTPPPQPPLTATDDNDENSTQTQTRTTPFTGNEQDYYSYHNSLIHKVLQSRKGIPLTLSIIYSAIVNRISDGHIHMEAVGLPGHFMLSTTIVLHGHEHERVFVDVFHGGTILTKRQCKMLICSRYRIPWDDNYMKPIQKSDVWSRMLRNLLNCHHRKINEDIVNGDGDGDVDVDGYNKKMMNAVQVLIVLGFHGLTDSFSDNENLAEILFMLSSSNV